MIFDCDFNSEHFSISDKIFCLKESSVINKIIKKIKPTRKVVMKEFGTVNNEKIYLFTLTNNNGMSIDLSTLGATITAIRVPDKDGKTVDVAQGYTSADCYTNYPVGHAGGTIGPCANKIDYGTFELNGQKYELEKNKDNGRTHCHGASEGFDIKNWQYDLIKNGIVFTYVKKDGEGNFPGNVTVHTTYILTDDNEIKIIYEAETDKDTVLNLTNHSYFNLDGEENAEENSVLNHVVHLPESSKYTVNSQVAVPTGEIKDVGGTPFDFRNPAVIKDKINIEDEQLKIGAGFDQNYCIDGYDGKKLITVAKVVSEKTGIELKVKTNLPGFQFYTANHLGKTTQPLGKSGKRYQKRSSLCVEPQFFPNAINMADFEKPILKKGAKYNREIIYSFDIKK